MQILSVILGLSLFIIIAYLLIGALIGWIAGIIMKGKGFGFIGNVLIAIAGSFLGGFVFKILHVNLNSFITAILGSILLVFLLNLIRGKK